MGNFGTGFAKGFGQTFDGGAISKGVLAGMESKEKEDAKEALQEYRKWQQGMGEKKFGLEESKLDFKKQMEAAKVWAAEEFKKGNRTPEVMMLLRSGSMGIMDLMALQGGGGLGSLLNQGGTPDAGQAGQAGTTATNSKTGQKMYYRNGKWQGK